MIICLMVTNLLFNLQAQDTVCYLFIGHPRLDDRDAELLLPSVERIEYDLYNLLLLGGDLTWNTSEDESILEYCDSILDLSSENTHLAMGNHDNDNLESLLSFTNKPRYYAFYRNKITFVVLDTEIDKPNITGDQLVMLENIADTIENSEFLVLLHHRIIWMIDNPVFAGMLDSVAASTKNLFSTNFYTDVYPILQNAKKKVKTVFCVAGDRTNMNIEYKQDTGIVFLASGMVGTYPDENNYAIEFIHIPDSGELQYKFISLAQIEKHDVLISGTNNIQNLCTVEFNRQQKLLVVKSNTELYQNLQVNIYNISGTLVNHTILNKSNRIQYVHLHGNKAGIYFVECRFPNKRDVKKIVLW